MKKHLRTKILLFSFLVLSFKAFSQAPPYSGTIFIDPDIITAADPSAFQSVSSLGTGQRTVFDRRVNNWVVVSAHLYEVVWNDGLKTVAVVNPEFTATEAATEARKYGILVGQLPYVLRTRVNELWIHKGVQPFGGGNNSILIHTGQTALYENDGILEETLVHEASHTSLDQVHAASQGWLSAQTADGNFISTYAKDYPTREDVAESFLLWLAARHRRSKISQVDYDNIIRTIPNRLAYFDAQNFSLSPLINSTLSASNTAPEASLEVSLSSSSGHLNVRLARAQKEAEINLIGADGRVAYRGRATSFQSYAIDLSGIGNGLYFVSVSGRGFREVRKFMLIR